MGFRRVLGALVQRPQQERLISKQWVDMDLVLAWHYEVLVGDPPRSPDDNLEMVQPQYGILRRDFCAERAADGETTRIADRAKGHPTCAPVSRMSFDRYVQGLGKLGFNETDLKRILAAAVWEDEEDQGEGMLSMQRNTKPSPRTKPTGKSLMIISLLETMRNTL
ncbi:hypothetical protein BJY00DRAFT_293389 [Aspergillus carlsbadensis]|nr:hypothetical protein BJY00DRAFT_293389 [Aspergillus carlsbadensis]